MSLPGDRRHRALSQRRASLMPSTRPTSSHVPAAREVAPAVTVLTQRNTFKMLFGSAPHTSGLSLVRRNPLPSVLNPPRRPAGNCCMRNMGHRGTKGHYDGHGGRVTSRVYRARRVCRKHFLGLLAPFSPSIPHFLPAILPPQEQNPSLPRSAGAPEMCHPHPEFPVTSMSNYTGADDFTSRHASRIGDRSYSCRCTNSRHVLLHFIRIPYNHARQRSTVHPRSSSCSLLLVGTPSDVQPIIM